jgi:hypothetical protein
MTRSGQRTGRPVTDESTATRTIQSELPVARPEPVTCLISGTLRELVVA